MNDRYHSTPRPEILPWLPDKVMRLLDVGCGTGATMAVVKQCRAVEWAGGIEYNLAIADRAEAVFDRVWRGDAVDARIEDEIAPASLDAVLCLDVLEHMPDPWGMVQRLSPLIAPGGRLIVSVPNIRHWKFIWRLLAYGDFRYRDAGLLDRTHLRFFVRSTAIKLAICGGLSLVNACSAQCWRPTDARSVLSRLSRGGLDEILAKQWLVVAEQLRR
jgi:2-polyprenyl-3-methyl-5-hydroxy-6-metoxy-1,4-benzoquinol methylase